MVNLELSLTNAQEVHPVDIALIEKKAGMMLEHIFNNRKLLEASVLGDYNLAGRTVSVDILLSDDEEIRKLNSSYRDKDCPTDVLSFALFADSPDREAYPEIALGEVIISVETAREQADNGGIKLEEQIDFLLCHGILHLMGYDHPDEESLGVMLGIQDEILSDIKT